MGFDLSLVESDERHYGVFVCPICQNLVDLDCLVTTICSHCFCNSCLPSWLERSSKCPTCNQVLLFSSSTSANKHSNMMIGDHAVLVQPLAASQPLAHRLLNSLLVKCPLRSRVACGWHGDYGDLEAHLLSSTAHSPQSTNTLLSSHDQDISPRTNEQNHPEQQRTIRGKQLLALATSLKEEGNSKFESKRFQEANALYTRAIASLEPLTTEVNAQSDENHPQKQLLGTLYSNRAAVSLQLQDYSSCISDCQHVIRRQLDPANAKVSMRASRAFVQLGLLQNAQDILQEAVSFGLSGQKNLMSKQIQRIQELLALEKQGNDQLDNGHFADAKSTFASLLIAAPSAASFLLGAAQADLGLGLTDSVLRLTKQVLVKHAQNPRACWIRGNAMILMADDNQNGIDLLQEALRLDPDSSMYKGSYRRAKKLLALMGEAQKLIFCRSFETAIENLDQCLNLYQPLPSKSALYAKLNTLRAESYVRLKRFSEALKICAFVLYAQEDCIPVWLLKFQAQHGLGEHSSALEDVQDVLRRWPQDNRLRQAYTKADFLVRKNKRVDFYALLGVSSIASEMEIKKAYKRRALDLHPDKVPAGSGTEARQAAQTKFQLLGEGLEILCDEFQRRLYDEGYDTEAIRERVAAAKQAAHTHRTGYPL